MVASTGMKQAVIVTGGKQYLVAPGQEVVIERLDGEIGDTIVFDDVRCIVDGDNTVVGTPVVADVKVTGKVLRQQRSDKVIVEKFKSKKRYHRFGTHRQEQTVVAIDKIA